MISLKKTKWAIFYIIFRSFCFTCQLRFLKIDFSLYNYELNLSPSVLILLPLLCSFIIIFFISKQYLNNPAKKWSQLETKARFILFGFYLKLSLRLELSHYSPARFAFLWRGYNRTKKEVFKACLSNFLRGVKAREITILLAIFFASE